jgi:hypothetical protein
MRPNSEWENGVQMKKAGAIFFFTIEFELVANRAMTLGSWAFPHPNWPVRVKAPGRFFNEMWGSAQPEPSTPNRLAIAGIAVQMARLPSRARIGQRPLSEGLWRSYTVNALAGSQFHPGQP